jgi:hypothetical protein
MCDFRNARFLKEKFDLMKPDQCGVSISNSPISMLMAIRPVAPNAKTSYVERRKRRQTTPTDAAVALRPGLRKHPKGKSDWEWPLSDPSDSWRRL